MCDRVCVCVWKEGGGEVRRITLLDRRHGVPEEEGLELQPRSCEGRDPLLQAGVILPVRKRPLLGVDAMRLEERDYVPDGLWGLVEGLQVRECQRRSAGPELES